MNVVIVLMFQLKVINIAIINSGFSGGRGGRSGEKEELETIFVETSEVGRIIGNFLDVNQISILGFLHANLSSLNELFMIVVDCETKRELIFFCIIKHKHFNVE